MNRVDTKIGNRIKSVREARKMTVEDIKKETGLSKSYLKEIENDDDTPNLGNVSKISKVLGIRTGTFLDGEEDLSPVVSSLKSRRRLNGIRGRSAGRDHMHFFSLSSQQKNRQMDATVIILDPAGGRKFYKSHEGEEFLLVLDGKLEVGYGKQVYVLKPGQSIYYDSIVPHHLASALKRKPCKILAVTYFPA